MALLEGAVHVFAGDQLRHDAGRRGAIQCAAHRGQHVEPNHGRKRESTLICHHRQETRQAAAPDIAHNDQFLSCDSVSQRTEQRHQEDPDEHRRGQDRRHHRCRAGRVEDPPGERDGPARIAHNRDGLAEPEEPEITTESGRHGRSPVCFRSHGSSLNSYGDRAGGLVHQRGPCRLPLAKPASGPHSVLNASSVAIRVARRAGM